MSNNNKLKDEIKQIIRNNKALWRALEDYFDCSFYTLDRYLKIDGKQLWDSEGAKNIISAYTHIPSDELNK